MNACREGSLHSMSGNLGERRMDLIGRPLHTMTNGIMIGYLYEGMTPLPPASN